MYHPAIILLFICFFIILFLKLPIKTIKKYKYTSTITRLLIILSVIMLFYIFVIGYDVSDAYFFPNSSLDVVLRNRSCSITLDPNTYNSTFVLESSGSGIFSKNPEYICFNVPKEDLLSGNIIPVSKLNMWHFCVPYSIGGRGNIKDGNVTIKNISRKKITMLLEFPEKLERFKEINTFELDSNEISDIEYWGIIEYVDVDKYLEHVSETEFGDPTVGFIETIEVSKKIGVDYKKVLGGCIVKDQHSMHTMFWVSENARFDAASHQGYCAVLGMLLRKLGDEYFGDCLSKEKKEIQKSVRDCLLYALRQSKDSIIKETTKPYPKTFPDNWWEE
jgi:hypothetical protein